MESIGTWWMWLGFFIFVVCAVAVDLLIMNKQGAHKVSLKEAGIWSLLWFSLAFIFAGILWWYLEAQQGSEFATKKTMEFVTGYLVEKSLSVDNIFVFLMIFSFFAVPAQYQKRALILGVIGAIVLRAVMILIGAWLLAQFHWILYVFGIFLVVTGIKMIWAADKKPDLNDNPVLKFVRKRFNVSNDFDGERLFTVQNGVRYATPLFLVLVMIAATDIVFAVDSIPAIFAITSDPFIVMTANIFAILGLRALYFLLADLADRFHYLSYGLAAVLIFIGAKMLLIDVYKIPITISLGVVALTIATSMIVSVVATKAKST